LKLLYDQALADFADEYSAAEILDHFGEVAGTLIAAGLEFLIDALGPWASITFDLFFNGIDIISQNVWTADFEATLTCLLLRNASIEGDIVTFDFQAVNRDLVFEHVSSVDDVLWIAQVEYMLMTIGADGLNLAGETTTVEGDCVDCGTWCNYWSFVTPSCSASDVSEHKTFIPNCQDIPNYRNPPALPHRNLPPAATG